LRALSYALRREVLSFACIAAVVAVTAGLAVAGHADWAVFALPIMGLCVVGWLVHH